MTNSQPPARLIDLTRSLRRAGRVATGIDRVEMAYLARFLADDVPLFGLARTAFGYVLIDRYGLCAIRDRLDGSEEWAAADLLSRLPRGRSTDIARAETVFRKMAMARCLPVRLAKMLATQLPTGTRYYNVGHSNLTDRVLSALRHAEIPVSVMVHDVIPLDFPQYQRPGTPERFEKMLRRIRVYAETVIYNSQDTKTRAEGYLGQWGAVPAGVVAHLGVDVPHPDLAALPADLMPDAPYFMCVGTIEPRKNHEFLLDIWDEMGADAPPLLICGNRGWNNDAVFARLDDLPANHPVQEINGLTDGALAALVNGAAGLLFPSHAEGFGLPPAEALALGTRTLCNDLPVLGEFLGEKAVFVSLSDRYLWINTIKIWAESPSDPREPVRFDPPNWEDHFKTVLRLS